MKRTLPLLAFPVILILLSTKPAFAGMAQEVLGVATESATLPQISPTSEGPGLILPDSPFFFVDQIKQNVRLAFAFSPDDKAKVREQIAGERIAELRFMLAKNDKRAAAVALAGVSENLREASNQVSKAQFQGKDVTKLAQNLNTDIKSKQETLDALEQKSSGSLQLAVTQAQESIFETKAEVDDALPADQLQNEITRDLERKINRKIQNASSSATLLKKDLEVLNAQASESATKSLKRREDALKLALEKSGNPEIRKVQEKLLEQEREKQLKILEAHKKAAAEATTAIENAQLASQKFGTLQKTVIQLQSVSVPPPPPGAPVPNTSGSSGSSGSGETESGSGKH